MIDHRLSQKWRKRNRNLGYMSSLWQIGNVVVSSVYMQILEYPVVRGIVNF